MAYNEVARSGKSTMLAGLCEVMSRSRDKARRRPTGHEYKTPGREVFLQRDQSFASRLGSTRW
jgi:hypothetical protein